MEFKLNPRREAAIKASQRAETAVDNAEEAYNTARRAGNYAARIAAHVELQAAREAAGDARRVVHQEYLKALAENGHA
ncbi:hypothetical protein JBE04_17950 [Streptomyces sp. PRKS01-29]|nr:hypothetical protein [Streptomyces sabulosicollis]MBI0296295.1 hypothetical protein [Streptomyces sabulosicollis]